MSDIHVAQRRRQKQKSTTLKSVALIERERSYGTNRIFGCGASNSSGVGGALSGSKSHLGAGSQ